MQKEADASKKDLSKSEEECLELKKELRAVISEIETCRKDYQQQLFFREEQRNEFDSMMVEFRITKGELQAANERLLGE